MPRKITIVLFDAGGGHRSAAEALKSVLELEASSWQVELLNIQELLDQLDVLRKATGLRIQDGYNLILRKGWTRLTPQLLPLLQGVIRLYHRSTVKLLTEYWRDHGSDLVLSVIPHFNRALAESLRKVSPEVPFVTLLTDFADYPPHFWIERQSQYLICGTKRAEQQALAMAHDRGDVFLASGMVMKPRFYKPRVVDRAEERKRLGLDPDRPTGLLLFGGHGSGVMLDIVRRLDAGRSQVQLIALCGNNQKLLTAIRSLRTRFPLFAQGFTSEVDYYMALSEFFIGKPGPGSISEALQFHLPVIVEMNGSTLPQERYNADWVTENGLGIVLGSFRQVDQAVERLLEPLNFAAYRGRAGSYRNRALYEIPDFLEQILERHRPPAAPLGAAVRENSNLEPPDLAPLTPRLQTSCPT
ncbi:MAG: galactosyldiacylglycerol synthase [Acidobacteria bacterium]|nr:galactosyldiacylglycerol synthase [Acidobacteriota bacterium]